MLEICRGKKTQLDQIFTNHFWLFVSSCLNMYISNRKEKEDWPPFPSKRKQRKIKEEKQEKKKGGKKKETFSFCFTSSVVDILRKFSLDHLTIFGPLYNAPTTVKSSGFSLSFSHAQSQPRCSSGTVMQGKRTKTKHQDFHVDG